MKLEFSEVERWMRERERERERPRRRWRKGDGFWEASSCEAWPWAVSERFPWLLCFLLSQPNPSYGERVRERERESFSIRLFQFSSERERGEREWENSHTDDSSRVENVEEEVAIKKKEIAFVFVLSKAQANCWFEDQSCVIKPQKRFQKNKIK